LKEATPFPTRTVSCPRIAEPRTDARTGIVTVERIHSKGGIVRALAIRIISSASMSATVSLTKTHGYVLWNRELAEQTQKANGIPHGLRVDHGPINHTG